MQGSAAALSPAMSTLLSDILATLHTGATAATAAAGAARQREGLLPRVLLVDLTAALAARDYTAALGALHAYFDHVQVRARAWAAARTGGVTL